MDWVRGKDFLAQTVLAQVMVSRMLVKHAFVVPLARGLEVSLECECLPCVPTHIDDRLPASAEGTVKSALGERAAQAVKVFEELYEFFAER